jgi:Zn finger protein HypA/HybF involved in hydrogenase expression
MHEWGITESVIKEIIRQAEEHGIKKVDKVCISLGEEADLTAKSLRFCFQNLLRETILESTRLEISPM